MLHLNGTPKESRNRRKHKPDFCPYCGGKKFTILNITRFKLKNITLFKCTNCFLFSNKQSKFKDCATDDFNRYAIENNVEKTIDAILCGANINNKDEKGDNILHKIIKIKKQMPFFLIDIGVDFLSKNKNNMSPIELLSAKYQNKEGSQNAQNK